MDNLFDETTNTEDQASRLFDDLADDDAAQDEDDTDNSDAAASDSASTGKHEHQKDLTEAELDNVADTAIESLRTILSFFDAGDCAIDEYEGDDGELILDVVGDDLAVLIGRYGKTLDALQYLVASIVNKKIGFRYPIVIDVEGYRNRKRQKLVTLAKSSAARCIRNKREVRLRPMTPSERRIIHIVLRDEKRVYTESEGEDPHRQIVIRPC
ncbi:MAG: KH domain-containing protein [Coriobacteriales bacterium]|jgi:spoIIIJ-associated protein|nr:KH domain-containing protein [Coriobacteriales bacterium]